MLQSGNKKVYGISSGTAGAIGIVIFYIARNGSYSANIIILGIFLVLVTLLLLLGIFAIVMNFIKKKKIKSKIPLLGISYMWVLIVLEFIVEYFKEHNINNNIPMSVMPLALIGFLYIGFKLQLSKLKTKKEIKSLKIKIIFCIAIISVFEIFMLYQTIILYK